MFKAFFFFLTALLMAGLTPALAADANPPGAGAADRIIVRKAERKLILMKDGQKVKTFRIALGGEPKGPKRQQGDNRTPEGRYRIVARNENSSYYKSLTISYPSEMDKADAARLGVDPGGDITIHGLPDGWGWLGGLHRLRDWTRGCIAVTNSQMDELWNAAPVGTPVEIRP